MVFGHFWQQSYKNTKILRNLCLHEARQDGHDRKKLKLSQISLFWFLVTFGDEVMKILRNLCLHLARQDGQDRKKQKENHATKVTKIPKTKRQK